MSDRLATEVILIAGRSGVGKSTTAYEVSRQLAASHVRHALIEGDNLDQAYPAPWRQGIPLAERNLAAMWLNYQELGYSKLIYTNTVSVLEIATLSAALGGEVTAVGILLTSSDETTRDRLAAREIGSGLEDHIRRSHIAARRLDEEASAQVYRMSTDARSIPSIASEILVLAGWGDPTAVT